MLGRARSVARPKHQDKGIEKLLRSLERSGWRVEKGAKHFKAYCDCVDKHWKTVKLTPSDPNYLKNLEMQLKRATCWKGER